MTDLDEDLLRNGHNMLLKFGEHDLINVSFEPIHLPIYDKEKNVIKAVFVVDHERNGYRMSRHTFTSFAAMVVFYEGFIRALAIEQANRWLGD